MPTFTEVPLIQFGLGGVGRELLRQTLASRDTVARRTGLKLRHVALVEQHGFVADPGGLDDDLLRAALSLPRGDTRLSRLPSAQARSTDDEDVWLIERLADLSPGRGGVAQAIVVDVTAAHGMEKPLLRATELGYGVVLSNKRPLTASLEAFRALESSGRLRHECTVGAALPVISTLRTLLDAGDQVTAIEGCFSGTLGYLCSALDEGRLFSAAVAEAKARGYTEPDPREDLGGVDVARKALILARMLGWSLNFEDIVLEALYPTSMDSLTVEAFLAAIAELDEEYARRSAAARARGNTLRYVAGLAGEQCEDAKVAKVGLREVSQASLMGSLRGTDNIVVFHSARYGQAQLVVAGPGAGIEVTAGGVLGDIVGLAREMGASVAQRM